MLLLRRQSKGFARDTSKLRGNVQARAPPRVPTPPPAPAPPASQKSAQPGGVRMHEEKPLSQKRAEGSCFLCPSAELQEQGAQHGGRPAQLQDCFKGGSAWDLQDTGRTQAGRARWALDTGMPGTPLSQNLACLA